MDGLLFNMQIPDGFYYWIKLEDLKWWRGSDRLDTYDLPWKRGWTDVRGEMG
jgi:hypothetical protein